MIHYYCYVTLSISSTKLLDVNINGYGIKIMLGLLYFIVGPGYLPEIKTDELESKVLTVNIVDTLGEYIPDVQKIVIYKKVIDRMAK